MNGLAWQPLFWRKSASLASPSFFRHGRAQKSLALLIWLNENVGFVLSAKSIIICEKQLISGIKCVIDDTFKFLLARLPCGYSHLIEPLSLKNAFLMGCAYGWPERDVDMEIYLLKMPQKKYVNINGKVSKDKWRSMFRYLAKYVKTLFSGFFHCLFLISLDTFFLHSLKP